MITPLIMLITLIIAFFSRALQVSQNIFVITIFDHRLFVYTHTDFHVIGKHTR